ncbi:hypothetical protein PVA45_08630 (plasmid) [Entomospira entomophila]|uniref:Uncharacterized protein n=1 Tax=Entomospira entomophila TaxID=2719988 RepID=A0A968GDH6_9SPIO|nr:hypothetical protein [Entomospira entomophilus]NIZ41573.1 hypothetical protein [Entomospira entomophilus]WDI36474.1 hypothetical protein PVA45_08630 [Entomospira entomophilus]
MSSDFLLVKDNKGRVHIYDVHVKALITYHGSLELDDDSDIMIDFNQIFDQMFNTLKTHGLVENRVKISFENIKKSIKNNTFDQTTEIDGKMIEFLFLSDSCKFCDKCIKKFLNV